MTRLVLNRVRWFLNIGGLGLCMSSMMYDNILCALGLILIGSLLNFYSHFCSELLGCGDPDIIEASRDIIHED